MSDLIFNIINEIKSYFIPEKIRYEITGECKKCGKCCNNVYSIDMESEQEFKFMQLLFPAYRRFYLKGKDEEGHLVFACKFVSEDGLCTVYEKRPRLCRNFPAKSLKYCAKLFDGCGYKVEKKNFKDYLNS